MILAQHVHQLFGLGALGEAGESAQVAEHDRHLAAMAGEQCVVAVRRCDDLCDLRREEAFEAADPADLGKLRGDTLLERLVPVAQLIGLLLELGRLVLHRLVRDRELAALVVDFGEQLRIAHRERGLVREGLHQADDVGREMTRRFAQDDERAENALQVEQRNDQHRVEIGSERGIAHRIRGFGVEVGDLERFPAVGRPAERVAVARDRQGLAVGAWRSDADGLSEGEGAARRGIAEDQDRIGAGDLGCARRDGRQHRVEIERRHHGAADLLEHFQLGDRLGEVARPFADLLLELRIRAGGVQPAMKLNCVASSSSSSDVLTSMRWPKSPPPGGGRRPAGRGSAPACGGRGSCRQASRRSGRVRPVRRFASSRS